MRPWAKDLVRLESHDEALYAKHNSPVPLVLRFSRRIEGLIEGFKGHSIDVHNAAIIADHQSHLFQTQIRIHVLIYSHSFKSSPCLERSA